MPGNTKNHPQRGGLVDYVCAACGKPFTAYASDRQTDTPAHSQSCASLLRERALGHGSVTAPCACGCGQIVTRPRSRTTGTGNLYVDGKHFWDHRRRLRAQAEAAHVTAASDQARRRPRRKS